jgi:RimJ/RimL family protein N-acetyltransferase
MLRTPPVWSVPILATPRLRLRAHTTADFDAYCTLWNDPDVIRYTSMKPSTPEETWSRLIRHAGHWSMLGFGSWLVEERSTGDLVGEVGIFDYHRNLDPPLKMPEIGWILSPAKHGHGYATEAATAMLAWAHDRFQATEITCIIHPDNTPSLKVAAKCGFTEYARFTYRDAPIVLLQRPL